MVGVLVSAVATVRTGFRPAVLGSIIVRPAPVGEAVALLGGGADVGVTGRTVRTRCVLCRAVLTVLRSRGMVAVGIGAPATVRAGIGAAMLGSGVVFPRTVRIDSVACAIVHQRITAAAILIPVTARPSRAGRCMVANAIIIAGIVISTGSASSIIAEGMALHLQAKSCITGCAFNLLLMLCCRCRFVMIVPIAARAVASSQITSV